MRQLKSIVLIICMFTLQSLHAATTFVTVNSSDWTEVSAPGLTAYITNSSVVNVRYVEAATKPPANIDTGHLLHPNDYITYTLTPGNKIYARTREGIGSIAVSPGSTFSTSGGGKSLAEISGPLTAFGELRTAELTPITQITAPYGALQKTESFTLASGTTGAIDSMFFASSGTTAGGLAALLSRRQISYKAGQGVVSRFTAVFDTPVADSSQDAGLLITTDQLGFGYEGTDFGIIFRNNGEIDLRELTITTPASGAENATININGTPYTVPLTAGTVQHNAYEISESLNAQVPSGFNFTSNDDQVVSRGVRAIQITGSFTFSSATSVANWNQLQVGIVPTANFIAQNDWNIDKKVDLDPSKGNVYEIRFQYLGFGGIEFYIEDSASADFVLVHRIMYANTAVIPSVGNPTFRVGWRAINGPTNTTDITVKGASAAGFVEGVIVRTEPPRAAENTNATVGTVSEVNILTIRNRIAFGSKRNRVEVFGLSLTAATDSTKAAIIEVRSGASITGDLDFQYVDKDNSVIEVAKDGGVVTGGRLIASFIIPPTGGQPFDLEQLSALILPGETLTISAIVTSGSASSVTASVIWQEDI